MTRLTLKTWCNPLISLQTTVNANAKLKFKHKEVVNHVQNGNCWCSDLSQIRSVTNQYFLHLHYQIRIQWLGNFNVQRMSNAIKLCEIRQRSNSTSNFVTSLLTMSHPNNIRCDRELLFYGANSGNWLAWHTLY